MGTVIIGTHELLLGEPVVDGSVENRTAQRGGNESAKMATMAEKSAETAAATGASSGTDIAGTSARHGSKNGGSPIVAGSGSKSAIQPVSSMQYRTSTNDHEASSSKIKPRDPKYTQPKWCPRGITKTQKRKLSA